MTLHDPASINGTTLPIQETVPLLVIGAGHAGLAAALAAARAGQSVLLVDENPVPAETMGDDVPLFFGGRMTGAARNRNAMTEAFIASDPRIEAAFDAGIDLRLSTFCWGIYTNGPSVSTLPGPVAGLSDGTRSWLVHAERIIVATGRRDMALAFDNWAQPGVMGIEAAVRLATRYGALDAKRAVILGTTREAVLGAETLAAAGVEIAALVEPGPAALAASAFPVLTQHVPVRAESGPDGVVALVLSHPGGETRIAADTVVLAIAAIPQIELLDSAHAKIVFDPARGGHVPVLDAVMQTTLPGVYAVGDAAGVWAAKSADPAIAQAEGEAAALGRAGPPAPATAAHDPAAYRLDWVRTTTLAAKGEPYVCQCEEVTAREILEVRPPRYLNAKPDRRNQRELSSLLGNGPPSPDQVKRLTRAGMGLCQGRRCREQVSALLALGAGLPLADIPLASHRAPVRPLPLRLAVPEAENPDIAAHWDVWFGMKSQYVPHWKVPTHFTSATRNEGSDRGTE